MREINHILRYIVDWKNTKPPRKREDWWYCRVRLEMKYILSKNVRIFQSGLMVHYMIQMDRREQQQDIIAHMKITARLVMTILPFCDDYKEKLAVFKDYVDEIHIRENEVFIFTENTCQYCSFGKTVFLTREEAEKALKEMEGNHE